MNFYKRNIGDFRKKTARLSALEVGIYDLFLDEIYATEEPLPLKERELFNIARAHTRNEKAAMRGVLERYFTKTDAGWENGRAMEELSAVADNSTAARSSASRRWGETEEDKRESNARKRSRRLAEARKKGRHTDEEWAALKHICDERCLQCGEQGAVVKDHITPIYQGGSDGIDNIQPLCTSCNSAKGPDASDLRPNDWQKRLRNACETPAIARSRETPDSRLQKTDTPPLPPPRGARDTRLPDDWLPNEKDIAFAREKGLDDERIRYCVEQFCDHWRAASGQKAVKRDWHAAWRTWVRNDKTWNGTGRIGATVAGGRRTQREIKREFAGAAQEVLTRVRDRAPEGGGKA